MAYTFGKQQRVMQAGDEDYRYRIRILLIAEKRPKYWEFHCVRCGQKVFELSGILASMSDGADINAIPNYQPAPVGYPCKGKFCRIWYEIESLSGRE